MYTPHLLIAVMKQFKCNAIEAQHWLQLDNNKAMIFSSGEIHIPLNWNRS